MLRSGWSRRACLVIDALHGPGSTGVDEKISMDCVLIDAANAAALETFQIKS